MPASSAASRSLEVFDPRIRTWFAERVGQPTDAQIRAWPLIAGGEHLMLTAPTGSGKTLAAFLWVIDRLVSGAWPVDATHVLYVSPLKALNNDIQRNLLAPLAELEARFREAGEAWPALRVLTRSGDTPPNERRRQILRPPEIFITTPETLNLMLASSAGPAVFGHLKVVILDEIHAVAASKRGTHLMTAIERLTELSGEFQRIALSATVDPAEEIAAWVGGRRRISASRYEPRAVSVVRARLEKAYEVRVVAPELPGPAAGQPMGGAFWWEAVTERLKAVIAENRSTLIFVNNRRLSERIAALLNENEPRPIATSHHGSLSHETRRTIEERLKNGELPAIVATASLELGIDIGALDQVVLLGTPPSVSSALQRMGRAGHGVGQVSRALIFPTYPRDLVDAAVMAGAVESRAIEPLAPIHAPLDLLAQWIVGMTGREARTVDELYGAIREAKAYRDLPRERLDDVLEMLAGESDGERLRAFDPLISWDRLKGTVRATPGALRSFYISGGTITDRGYFAMRQESSNTKIGELDEEFVWEQWPGITFTFGAQAWTIQKITDNDVIVRPGNLNEATMPFWRGEDRSRDLHFSGLIADWLEGAETHLAAEVGVHGTTVETFEARLMESGRLEPEAAARLARTLRLQRRVTGAPLPHRHHLLAEYVPIHGGDRETLQLILHLPWGGRVNRPLGLVLAALWEEREGARPPVFAGNDGIARHLPRPESAADLLREIPVHRLEELLRRTLEGSNLFGAHFREAATRALLLPRSDPRRRMPLWLSRVKAKQLYTAVARHPNFPLLLEAWRSCLQDEFSLPKLREMLEEIHDGSIAVSEVHVEKASPFAEGIVWRETNALMYRGDTTPGGPSAVRPDLIAEVAATPALRPRIPADVAVGFLRKLHRVHSEYAPYPDRDLVDWVKQRQWIPAVEWRDLIGAVARDHPGVTLQAELPDGALVWVRMGESGAPGIAARDALDRLVRSWAGSPAQIAAAPFDAASACEPPGDERSWSRPTGPGDAGATPGPEPAVSSDRSREATWLGNWLSFYGPVARDFIHGALGVASAAIDAALEELIDAGVLFAGDFIEGATGQICDAENYERLLRLARRAARPSFEALPPERLALFLAWRQGLTEPGRGTAGLQERLEPLLGLPLPAGLVEREFLPARLRDYSTAWLDATFQESDLLWSGAGREKIVIAFAEHFDLLRAAPEGEDSPREGDEGVRASGMRDEQIGRGSEEAWIHVGPIGLEADRPYAFAELLRRSAETPSKFAGQFWDAVWAGKLAGEAATALRRGVLSDFRMSDSAPSRRGVRRGISRQARWQSTDPFPGPWRVLMPPGPAADALDDLEQQKDRVRLLLGRYGVLFRELLANESPRLRWSSVFRALRLMELSGEVLAGHFFRGVAGLQFIAPDAFASLRRGLEDGAVYWLNAVDPASICGLGLQEMSWKIPARRPTTHLAFIGDRPAIIAERSFKSLRFLIEPDHPRLEEVLALLGNQLTRAFDPLPVLVIEKIDGRAAADSPFLPAIRSQFECSVEPARVLVSRRYA